MCAGTHTHTHTLPRQGPRAFYSLCSPSFTHSYICKWNPSWPVTCRINWISATTFQNRRSGLLLLFQSHLLVYLYLSESSWSISLWNVETIGGGFTFFCGCTSVVAVFEKDRELTLNVNSLCLSQTLNTSMNLLSFWLSFIQMLPFLIRIKEALRYIVMTCLNWRLLLQKQIYAKMKETR